MKIIIWFIILILISPSITFSQSVLDYQTGTSVNVQTGADVCADKFQINGAFSGGGTLCGATPLILNLTVFIQGFYDPALNNMVTDTLRVYLRNASSPFAIVDSAKSVLNTAGAGSFLYFNAVNGTNYYLVTKHRNSLETWSATANPFTSGTQTYNFTPAANNAFGSNQILVDTSPIKFAVYGGDADQNGYVDLSDIIIVFNDATDFVTGYVVSDLTGDDTTDLSDIIIAYNNSSNFVSLIRP